MAQGHGQIKTSFGTAYWSAKPTAMDKIGCDGLYIERIDLLPWWRWPVLPALRVVSAAIIRRISNAEHHARPEAKRKDVA